MIAQSYSLDPLNSVYAQPLHDQDTGKLLQYQYLQELIAFFNYQKSAPVCQDRTFFQSMERGTPFQRGKPSLVQVFLWIAQANVLMAKEKLRMALLNELKAKENVWMAQE